MNIILVTKEDFTSQNSTQLNGSLVLIGTVILNDRRFKHIKEVHKAEAGDKLRVGILHGNTGLGKVIEISEKSVTLELSLTDEPLKPLPLTLILALPRPKMLKRILQSAASLGVAEIYLINSYKVDKSYWSSPVLSEDSLNEHLQLGLEQGISTQLPKIHLRKRFKPFVEDELGAIAKGSEKLVAHPYNASPCPIAVDQSTTLIIGPEGGFIEYEINKLCEIHFQTISLGKRILRVETAIPFAIAKLFSS